MARRLGLLAPVLFVLVMAATVDADTIKRLHIRNPFDDADDVHVHHFSNITDIGKMDKFDGVATEGKVASFAGAGQTLKKGATGTYDVKLKGATVPTAANIVTQVDFTKIDPDTGKSTVFKSLTFPKGAKKEDKDARKEFRQNVTGFTNEEFFDFSDLTSGSLNILNSEADLNLQYTFSDFKVFKDLPLSNFEIGSYMDVTGFSPLFSAPSVELDPGESLVIPLGPVDIGTYALATVGTITVTDLSSGVTFAYDVPQGFGVDVVPEPGALLPVSVMLLGFGCYGFYRWRQSRGPSTTV